MIKAYKLYTGEDGHSHVEVGTIEENLLHPVGSIRFKETPPHTMYEWHTAPVHQYVITISGTLEFTTYTGETFILQPGEILIALDTTGSGHRWRLIDDAPWRRVYVTIRDQSEINFVEANTASQTL
jgi:quercetin dioxygenase-like cupin family protein